MRFRPTTTVESSLSVCSKGGSFFTAHTKDFGVLENEHFDDTEEEDYSRKLPPK